MAQALERLLGQAHHRRLDQRSRRDQSQLKRIHLHESGHPVPDERGVEGARRILEIARESGPRDLLIVRDLRRRVRADAASGAGMTLSEKKAITRQLLASGATIHEMNTVRKHLSAIKGGHLAALAHRPPWSR